jgi:hypothetical protein
MVDEWDLVPSYVDALRKVDLGVSMEINTAGLWRYLVPTRGGRELLSRPEVVRFQRDAAERRAELRRRY